MIIRVRRKKRKIRNHVSCESTIFEAQSKRDKSWFHPGKMQYTGSSQSAHHQNVNYAKRNSNSCADNHQTTHRKRELLSSESDISSEQIQLRNKLKRNRNDVHSACVRRKVAGASALLFLLTLVVKLELVIGALPLTYNSVNYYDNSTHLRELRINRMNDRPRPNTSIMTKQRGFRPSIVGFRIRQEVHQIGLWQP